MPSGMLSVSNIPLQDKQFSGYQRGDGAENSILFCAIGAERK